jgi:hypothetical protein
MLRFLLDETISRKVALLAKKRCPEMEIMSLHDWENGRFLGMSDGEILKVAVQQHLTFVTYDQSTVLMHMAQFIPEGCDHGGIIVIDGSQIAQRDIGGLVKALCWLWDAEAKPDWKNRAGYLRPVRH